MTFPDSDDLDRRVFWVLFALLAAIFTLPILLVWHPPAMDLPGHLALGQVLASRHSASDPYSGLFSLPSWPSPNTLYYYLVSGLARFIPIEWASKLMLCLGLVGTPLALAAARRANHEGRSLALTGFPLALTFNFIAGFVGFVLALPLMIWLGALARTQISCPTRGRAALMALVGVLVYLAHAQVFLFAVGLVGLVALCGLAERPLPGAAPGWITLGSALRRFLATTAPLLVPILFALPWYLDRVRLLRRYGSMDMRYSTLGHNLRLMPINTFDQLTGDLDVWLGLGVLTGMLALACLGLAPIYRREAKTRSAQNDHQETEGPRSSFKAASQSANRGSESATRGSVWGRLAELLLAWLSRSAFWLATLAAVITYFTLPTHIRFQAIINGRQAVVVLLLFAAAVRMPRGRLPAALLLCTLGLSGAYGALYASATFRLDRELAGVRDLLAKARPHSRLVDPYRPKSPIWRMDVLRHVGSYHVVQNRGLVADTFARWPVQPIRTTRFFHMPGFAPHRPDPYHYVLSGRPLRAPRLALLGKAGPYHLYQVLPPKPRPGMVDPR